MKVKEITFVCYGVKNFKRARKFYEGVLGLKPSSVWDGGSSGFVEYWFGPHTLAIGKGAKNFKPGKTGGTVALEVADFNAAIKKLKAKKVKFLMQPFESKVCHMALISDNEGNQIMIHKRKNKGKSKPKK